MPLRPLDELKKTTSGSRFCHDTATTPFLAKKKSKTIYYCVTSASWRIFLNTVIGVTRNSPCSMLLGVGLEDYLLPNMMRSRKNWHGSVLKHVVTLSSATNPIFHKVGVVELPITTTPHLSLFTSHLRMMMLIFIVIFPFNASGEEAEVLEG
eukprot:6736937-Ditylum_brightwellii.AAC.1